MSLIEICVASMLLSIALIGILGSMGNGLSLIGQGRQRSSATEVAQQATEHVHDVPYTRVALNVWPSHSVDPSNPDYNIAASFYDQDGSGSQPSEPLVVDTTNGAIPHIEDPVTVGTTQFNIYQFVTWVDDPSIPGTNNYKRVVVDVTWKNQLRHGSINNVTQTTLVSDGTVTVPQTTLAPSTPGTTTHLAVNSPASSTTGQALQFTVTAQDIFNATVTSYTDTVHFTSSDTAATLPSDYTFTSSDAGIHQFNVTFNTAGAQSLAVSDTTSTGVVGTGTTSVSAPTSCPSDTTAPVGSMQLQSGTGSQQGYTGSTTLQVQLTATDTCAPLTAELSNNGTTWTSQSLQSGTSSVTSWSIPSGDGAKTVYARFRDGAGNVSSVSSGSLTLDQTAPTSPTGVGRGLVACKGSVRTVTLVWNAGIDTNLLGYRLYRSVDNGAYAIVATAIASLPTATDLNDSKNDTSARYVVRAYDKAGNESSDQSSPFSLSKGDCS